MTKLTNGVEFTNPCFGKELGDYLIYNGFICTLQDNALQFTRRNIKLMVRHDCVDLFHLNLGNEQHTWEHWQSFTGIKYIDLFDWVMLLQAMKVISIKEFAANASNIGNQHAVEAQLILRNVLHSNLLKVS